MNNKELIRRALMGSREAQRACTDKGIALPCPFCGGTGDNVALQNNPDSTQFWGYCWGCHAEGPIAHGSVKNALSIWNTRPAPPVGRCKDCVWSREPTEQDYKELDRDLLSYKDSLVCYFWEREVWDKDFCSYFDKREENINENN